MEVLMIKTTTCFLGYPVITNNYTHNALHLKRLTLLIDIRTVPISWNVSNLLFKDHIHLNSTFRMLTSILVPKMSDENGNSVISLSNPVCFWHKKNSKKYQNKFNYFFNLVLHSKLKGKNFIINLHAMV